MRAARGSRARAASIEQRADQRVDALPLEVVASGRRRRAPPAPRSRCRPSRARTRRARASRAGCAIPAAPSSLPALFDAGGRLLTSAAELVAALLEVRELVVARAGGRRRTTSPGRPRGRGGAGDGVSRSPARHDARGAEQRRASSAAASPIRYAPPHAGAIARASGSKLSPFASRRGSGAAARRRRRAPRRRGDVRRLRVVDEADAADARDGSSRCGTPGNVAQRRAISSSVDARRRARRRSRRRRSRGCARRGSAARRAAGRRPRRTRRGASARDGPKPRGTTATSSAPGSRRRAASPPR